VLLLTDEDDFNALGSTVLQGSVEGSVYRLAARRPGHGLVVPYSTGEVLFGAELTRFELGCRYARGARIAARPADGTGPADYSLLFLVRANGRLVPVIRSGPPPGPQPGDTRIVLLPGPELTAPAPAAT
jgi:hypothetical protein